MAKTNGGIQKGTYEVVTALNAVDATTTSGAIQIQGAKRITWYFQRTNHSSGSSTFSVDVSVDGTNFVDYNKLISNATNTNAQTLTRVASVALASNTASIVSMDLEHDTFYSMKVTATEDTDGNHTAIAIIER